MVATRFLGTQWTVDRWPGLAWLRIALQGPGEPTIGGFLATCIGGSDGHPRLPGRSAVDVQPVFEPRRTNVAVSLALLHKSATPRIGCVHLTDCARSERESLTWRNFWRRSGLPLIDATTLVSFPKEEHPSRGSTIFWEFLALRSESNY